ncbi:MAG: hypothetical protein V3R80_00305, partial [Candidatus Tectomicrobia bacterium]
MRSRGAGGVAGALGHSGQAGGAGHVRDAAVAITYRQLATVIVPAFMIELHTPPHHIGDDVDTLSSMETTFWVSIGLALL